MPMSSVSDRTAGMEKCYEDILKGYRDRVSSYYAEEYESNPNRFPVMKPTLLITVLFKNDTYFVFASSETDSLSVVQATEEQNSNLSSLRGSPKDEDEDFIKDISNVRKENIFRLILHHDLGQLPDIYFRNVAEKQNFNTLCEEARQWGRAVADKDYNTHKLEMAFKEVMSPSTDYLKFDINVLFAKVNDNDFKYELEEAIKAYNSNLYLAATTTAAVAIETLLKRVIITKLGDKKVPQDQYILSFAKTLQNENVITDRQFHRIRAANELRRGSAHSKSGSLTQWDADQVISCAKILVDELF